MDSTDWIELFVNLQENLDTIKGWEPEEPKIDVLQCEQSRHRTLAHLRACQEQWLHIVLMFLNNDSPNLTILHPWRQFEIENYASLDWDLHLKKFIEDRQKWMNLRDTVDRERGGKWNRKPDTIEGLTRRLADHESYHLRLCT